MVTQHEIDTLRGAFKDILREAQAFERFLADPRVVFSIAAMAQNLLYATGVRNGYDWRTIHVVVDLVDGKNVTIDPRPLNLHTTELVQKAMEVNDLAPQTPA